MRKLKLLIVEDQENYIKSLDLLMKMKELDDFIDLNNSVIAKTFKVARTLMLTLNEFDLSILDYGLDDARNCLQLLEETKKYISNYGQIVYTTINSEENENFHKYQIASKYKILEKPFDTDAFEKLIYEIHNKINNNTNSTLKHVLNLGISGEKIVSDINTILFVQGAGQYCNVSHRLSTYCHRT